MSGYKDSHNYRMIKSSDDKQPYAVETQCGLVLFSGVRISSTGDPSCTICAYVQARIRAERVIDLIAKLAS